MAEVAAVEVRKATEADVTQLGVTLARAFQDDPAFSWAAPDAARRERAGPRYFELLLRRTYLPKGEVYVAGDGAAAALWAPPEKWQVSTAASLPLFPVMLRACGRHLSRALRMLSSMEATHKTQTEPHYYLPFIGTDPASQGKGFGTALVADMVARCDAEGVPAYLEATSTQNQALYHRHGFVPLEELHWVGGGPPWWPMWRKPKAA
ncbi:MAG: GNAT family N-acetyltransferase [Actinobacteria bacterium]|nr:GNAT family N-acetyltransferase [Actinomycetota bacterium]